MNEINPYEPPQSVPDEKVSPSAVKQVVGLGTILLLSPIAMGVAFFASCLAVNVSVDPMIRRWGFDVAIPFGLLVFILPPLATLIGMIVWAVRVYGRRQRTKDARAERNRG